MTRQQFYALVSFAVLVANTTAPASAAIKAYTFSGTYTGGGAPLTDLLAGVELGDPFSGTVTFDSTATGTGQPLSISVLLDNTHQVNWSTASQYNQVAFFDSGIYPDSLAVSMTKSGTPEAAFQSDSSVFASLLGLDLYAAPPIPFFGPPLPTIMAELDLASSIFTRQYLRMELHGPSLYFGNLGEDTSVTVLSSIDSFSIVPEPDSMVLACLAATGLAVSSLRRRRPCRPQGHIVRDHR